MSLVHLNRPKNTIRLQNCEQPELYRDLFPYSKVSRIAFDDISIMPRPADPMFITDTTFRDGQQARPPYTVRQMVTIFDMLHRLGGMSGLIRASEFFMYSDKDKAAIDACRARGYKFPEVTGWIRANINDLKIARDMEFSEVGMLTSVSDYHIFLKLGLSRQQAMDKYLTVIEKALDWGIVPRCHFEDVTRADIHGFCLPFAAKLMDMAREAKTTIKIRLCDTMGYGVPYAGATLPRSVARVVRAFTDEAGVPGSWLEWHGHNDFHKVLVNGVTAWLYGCGGINGTLLGFGERTGNSPIEGLIMEYISLTGNDDAADPSVITEIAEYFQKELGYNIPHNYPFVGRDFNATSAGIHVDGLNKNAEIYSIFDTQKILRRPVPIIITDKSGRAGVAYWINHNLHLAEEKAISKAHPAVGQIYDRIMELYEEGRTTSFSNEEMQRLVQRFMPELFVSEFEEVKRIARKLAESVILQLASDCAIETNQGYPSLQDFVEKFNFIQYVYLTDTKGTSLAQAISDPANTELYKTFPLGYDFSDREWFNKPMHSGMLHITDVYQSQITRKLVLTVSAPVTDNKDNIRGIVGADILLDELLKHKSLLEDDSTAKF